MKVLFLTKAAEFLRDLSPDCKEAVRRKSKEMDGQLGASARIGLRLHLLLCKWCRRYSRQLEFLQAAARSESPDSMGLPGLSAEARARMVKNLQTAKNEENTGNGRG